MASPAQTARDLIPTILSGREETESARRLADPVVRALRRSGLLRMALAGEDGGLSVPLTEMLEVQEALGGAEAAAAWTVYNSAVAALLARFMAPALKAELFGDPQTLICQSTRPKGTATIGAEGARVAGRWDLVSGCELADWALLTCLRRTEGEAPGDGPPDMVFAALPAGDYTVIDTWRASGLRGTGSHDVEVLEVPVPEHRVFSLGAPVEPRGATGRLPVMATIGALFAAQMLGAARAALEHIVGRGRAEVTAGPMPDLRDRPEAQTGVAAHAAALDAARMLLHARADAAWAAAEAGDPATSETITGMSAANMHAIAAARAAMQDIHALGGSRALYESSPLERARRDMDAMSAHIVAQPTMRADVGRALLGLEPNFPLYGL